jgi:hypothetical protein
MKTPKHTSLVEQRWGPEALTLAAQASTLSGNKLEQLVVRLQRHSGRSKRECWRFVIQHGLKNGEEHRRWTEKEIDYVRESLINLTIEEIATKLKRTPKAVRSMLVRNRLCVREIRCDVFSVETLAQALRVRTDEVRVWITEGWLQATLTMRGKRRCYTITPEALAALFKNHLTKVLDRGAQNQALFHAYFHYCYSPKHTVGEQLLDVRRDKRERAAFAALSGRPQDAGVETDEEEDSRQFHLELDRSYGMVSDID